MGGSSGREDGSIRDDESTSSPKIYRVMKAAGDRPMVGSGAATLLGIRDPLASRNPDITPDEAGDVRPGSGGMSVSPSLGALLMRVPARLIPMRLRALAPKAAGNNNLRVWRMGSGPFAEGAVAEALRLRPDPKDDRHGFVEPDAAMSLARFRGAIEATRELWTDGEIE